MNQVSVLIKEIQNFIYKLKKDAVSAYAAQAAFFIMLSAFPFLMFLLTLIQYLPVTKEDLTMAIHNIIPSGIVPIIDNIINEIYTSPGITLLSVTGIVAIWSASKAFYALIHGLNAVYGICENRNYFLLRIIATLYTFAFAIILLITLSILGFGNRISLAIFKQFPGLKDFALLIISLRAATALCILILFFLALYMVIPNRKSRILHELPGSIATTAGWIIFSYLYSFYIDHLSFFSNTYGSLTAIILLMLWLYACMYILLIGGEINDYLSKKGNKVDKS